jgi:predicted PurR-regulated permease PerM
MKTVIRITIGLMMFLIVGVTSLWAIASPNYSKAQRFTNVVSSLPISTSKDRIERLLQKEGLEYSYVSDRSAIDITSAVAKNGYRSSDLSGYIVAIIRNTSGGVLVSGNMQYFFFFGKDGKLLKATADQVMTGP